MSSRIAVLSISTILGVSASIALTTPAQAATTDYACPTAAGYSATSFDVYDPTSITSNPVTELVGCTSAFAAPQVGIYQPAKDVNMWFGPLPASAFNGNDLTIRLVGTPANYGFVLNIWTGKDTAKSAWNNPDYVHRNFIFSGNGTAGNSSDIEKTQDFTLTVTDPAVRAKILAGDWIVQAGVVGGAAANKIEAIRSVSIAYTKYSVAFNNNGGSGTMTDAEGAIQANLPTSTFTREGYLFNGWNDDQNGNGNSFTDGAPYNFDADTTLYAQWIVDPNANNGGGDGSSSGDGSSDSAHLPNTGVDVSTLSAVAVGFMGVGILFALIVLRRRTR